MKQHKSTSSNNKNTNFNLLFFFYHTKKVDTRIRKVDIYLIHLFTLNLINDCLTPKRHAKEMLLAMYTCFIYDMLLQNEKETFLAHFFFVLLKLGHIYAFYLSNVWRFFFFFVVGFKQLHTMNTVWLIGPN